MKQIKNYGYSLLFAGALLFASGVANAENSHQLNDEAEISLAESVITISEDGCTMRAKGKTKDGVRYKIKGSCAEVLKTLKAMGEV